ncbi:MAG TPA: sugar kinase [Bacteroidota bacterium]|nr:sugar kinase [Bacteroidota bacterium]
MAKHKIVTFGEIMLRLSTPGFSRFVQAQQFDINYGGGEANVAASVSQFGLEGCFVTKLPKHEIGEAAVNELRRYGVNVDHIVRGGDRLGIYFLETGASQRASKVIYDRANASVSEIKPGEIDWTTVFKGASWFHWTGITPAIGKNLQEILKEACSAARKLGVTVSADLNYRKKLWTEKEARAVMIPLMEYVDVCISNEEDADKCLGMKAGDTNVESASIDESGYASLAQSLKKKFNFSTVAITLRESFSASRNGWSAMLVDDKDCTEPYRSKQYDIQIVDRVGGGDSFAGGLIYGLLMKSSSREALEFAVAASCLKQTIPGDFNHVSVAEVDALAKGSGSGRVER